MNSNLFRVLVLAAIGATILSSPAQTLAFTANAGCSVHVAVSPTSNSVPIGGTVVFGVSIKSSCGTDHIGWGVGATSPTPTVKCDKQGVCTTNAPLIHQSTYHVVGSGSSSFTATPTDQTLMTTWTFTVSASDVSHCCASSSTTVTLTVTNFAVTASPSSLTVQAGQTATSTITTSGQNGFTGSIYLSFDQPGYVCSLQGPYPVTLSSSVNSVNSILTCNFPKGTFTVTVTGTPFSGVPSRTATVTITVD